MLVTPVQESQTITIEDNTAPVISGVEESFTVECPDDYMFSEPTVSDTCDGGVQTSNQIVDVNAGSTWFAFMQWYDSNPDFNGNAPWGVSDAVAIPNVDDNTVTLKPNRVNDLASYWINDPADTFGRKTMVAATYVEDNSLVATAFNYAGNVSDYTLDGDYSVNVFIKVFQANFQNALVLSKPISSEGDFSITYDGAYEGAAIVQYGFEMTGANVNPLADFDAVYNALGSVVVTATSNELTLTYEDDDKTDECGLGTITRTWTATDCAGNESTASQTITIEDNVDPYFNEELPQDITNVDCESVPEAAVLTASDACDQDIKVDFEQVRDDGNCAGNYTLTRTWSASDCAGNSIEHVQVIHVTDTTPPVLVGDLPESMNELNACQGAYMDAPLSEEEFALLFTDNCSDVVVSLDTSAVGDDCGWSVMHKYAVSDDCGNSLGNFKVYYSGSDMTAPELMEAPADVTVSCDDVPEADDLMAMDDCKGDFSVKAEDTVQSVGDEACGNYDITRTWTAVDNCGNETVHTQVIQVRDMEAPELTGDLPEGTNENDACAPESDEELAALGVLTASEFAALYTDDCNTVVVNREHNIDGDDCKWIMWVRYDVSDSCGNEAQSVKLWYHGGDATAPEITKAEDVTEECDGTDDALNAWLADNGGNTATDCGEFTWTNDYDSRASTEGDGCTTVTTVTFTATDACGNDSETTSTFTVEDTIDPVIACPDDEDFGLNEPVFAEKATFTDACAGDGETSDYSDSEISSTPGGSMVVSNNLRIYFTNFSEYIDFDSEPAGIDDNGYPYYFAITRDIDTDEDTTALTGYSYTLNYDDYFEDWNLNEYYYNYGPYLVGYGGGYDGPDVYPSCDAYWDIEYDHSLECEQMADVINKSLTRTFTASDGCNESSCDVSYNWVEIDEETPVLSSSLPRLNGLPKVERPTQTQAGSNEGEAMGVELDFMAYPVPFDRDINVKFNFEFDTDVVIDIHDTRGLLVKSVTLNNVRANSDVKKSFDLSRAGDQLFYITVTTNRGSVTKKAVSSNMKRR